MIREKFASITPFTGLVVIAFVVLVGALGYSYVMSYGAQVAKVPVSSHKIPAQTMTSPKEVKSSQDLVTLQDDLNTASTDDLSSHDLSDIETSLNNL